MTRAPISRRRVVLASALASSGVPTFAADKVRRIGALGVVTWEELEKTIVVEELGRNGFVNGRNLVFISRTCGSDLSRLDALAAELVALKVDLILSTAGTPSALAAKRATTVIPIVMNCRDPVEDGIVQSLERPGGNITGGADIGAPLVLKCLELLLDAIPKGTPLGYLTHPLHAARDSERRTIEALRALAASSGSSFSWASVRAVSQGNDFEYGLATLDRMGARAILINNYSTIGAEGTFVAERLIAHRFPAMMETRDYATSGVLMIYSEKDEFAQIRTAGFIVKILNGAKPRDLPIERPTRFELLINMRTARALGLAIPQPLLVRADELLE